MNFVQHLLSAPLPGGAEIHYLGYGPAAACGYIDDTFEREDGGWESPYPLTNETARTLIAHGAVDRRQEGYPVPSLDY